MRPWQGALGAVIVCVMVGGAVGYAVGGSAANGPSAPFSARPMSASPSLPMDPPTSYAPDNDMPPLPTDLPYSRVTVGTGTASWSVMIPTGWQPGPGADGTGSTIWRPADEQPGGYQVRVEPLQGRDSARDKMAWQTRHMPAGTTTEYFTSSTIWYDYRDAPSGLHRFDFFTWVPAPGTDFAGLEISVAGRDIDVDGLNAMLQRVRSSARQLPAVSDGPDRSSGSAPSSAVPAPSGSASAAGSASASASASASG